jgi:23S rRNA pseudouridine1911/1915/1917 synthase
LATLRFPVPDHQRGLRLDRVVATRPEIVSRTEAERLLGAGAVTVGGVVERKSRRVTPGELVVIELPPEPVVDPPAPHVEVVWQDEHLLVVDKPAGLVVHPSGRGGGATLAHAVGALGAAGGEEGRHGIVHRLDKDTSGLLVVARSEDVHRRLANMVRRRELERRYLALVRGEPRSKSGRIEAPVGRDRRDRTRMSIDTMAPRNAVTWFDLVERLAEHALLDVRLETGRTHQIRVHLAAIDLPIAGDSVYGVGGDLGLHRQFLHAHRLRFVHPVTGELVDAESPLPADLAGALDFSRRSGIRRADS